MPLVVIVGPDFIGTCGALARGFNSHGWESAVFTWGGPKPNVLRRFEKKILGKRVDQVILEKRFNRLLEIDVTPHVQSQMPDLIIFIKPQHVTDKNKKGLRKLDCPIITWATDSLERFPAQRSLHEVCRRTYVMDGGDVESPDMSWLPLGFDDQVFKPVSGRKILDVLFVGNVFRRDYSTRRLVFEKLVRADLCGRARVGFVGSSPVPLHNYIRWMPGRLRWISRNLPLPQLAEVIARSRICINVHQDDGQKPVNPMFFAIPGCKVCQIVDARAYLQNWLREGSDYASAKPGHLLQVIDELLSDHGKSTRIAACGYEMAKEHTFTSRARQILDDLGFG